MSNAVLDYDSIIQYDDVEYGEFEDKDGGLRGNVNIDGAGVAEINQLDQDDDPFTSSHPTALVVDDYDDIDDINSYYSATSSTKSFSPVRENMSKQSLYQNPNSTFGNSRNSSLQISPSRLRTVSMNSLSLSGSGSRSGSASVTSASSNFANRPGSSYSTDRRSQVFDELDAVQQRIRKLRVENERIDGRVNEGNEENEGGYEQKQESRQRQQQQQQQRQQQQQQQEHHQQSPQLQSSPLQHPLQEPPQQLSLFDDGTTQLTSATSTYSQLEHLEWDHQQPISTLSSSPPRSRRSVSLQGYYQPDRITPERATDARRTQGVTINQQIQPQPAQPQAYLQTPQTQQQNQPSSPSERHVINLLDRAKRLRSNDPMINLFEKVVSDTMNVYSMSENYEQTRAIDQVYLSLSEFLLSYCDLVPDIGGNADAHSTPTPSVNGRTNSMTSSIPSSRFSYGTKNRGLPSQYQSSPLAYENGSLSVYDGNTRFREQTKSSPLTRTQSSMGGFQRPIAVRRRNGGSTNPSNYHRFSGDFSRYDNYF